MAQHAFPEVTGVIIVDHGSRRPASNEMLHTATQRFAEQSEFAIVEPAHMELAEPTIAQAFANCVRRGATSVLIFPYFLSPGRHWTDDIPALVAKAANQFPDVKWLVTAPFGLHPGMLDIINDRIRHCLHAAQQENSTSGCDVCDGTSGCQFRGKST